MRGGKERSERDDVMYIDDDHDHNDCDDDDDGYVI